jgi:hypothetical protein
MERTLSRWGRICAPPRRLRRANLQTTAIYVQVSDPKRVEAGRPARPVRVSGGHGMLFAAHFPRLRRMALAAGCRSGGGLLAL